jgi:NifU-like protein involved in Fe-S cluster formation
MSDELYQKALLKLAGAAHGAGRLSGPCCSGREANAMCGDVVTFDVQLDGASRIAACANELKGCVLVQASASLLSEHAKGCSAFDITAIKTAVTDMLNGGDNPDGVWAAYEVFKPASTYRSRHSCVLLPIEALEKALKDCGQPN